MDVLALLARAEVCDIEGFSLGEVFAIKFVAGKMVLALDRTVDEMYLTDDDDPDDGEEVDVPEDHPKLVMLKQPSEVGERSG